MKQVEVSDGSVAPGDGLGEDAVAAFKKIESAAPSCQPIRSFCSQMHAERFSEAKALMGNKHKMSGWDNRPCPDSTSCELLLGEEVLLMYWPTAQQPEELCTDGNRTLAAPNVSVAQPLTFVTTAITFRGQDLYLLGTEDAYNLPFTKPPKHVSPSILYGDWTLTSPTIYLAHHPITGVIKGWTEMYSSATEWTTLIRPAGLLTLEEEDMYSYRPIHKNRKITNALQYAQLVARGSFDPMLNTVMGTLAASDFEVRKFDFRDLQDPVPASVYFDARWNDCWDEHHQSQCATITDDSYRPSLSIKPHVWASLLPKDLDCGMPVLVDPPVAMRPVPRDEIPAVVLPVFTAVPTAHGSGISDQVQSEEILRPGQVINSPLPLATRLAMGSTNEKGGRVEDRPDLFGGTGDNHETPSPRIIDGTHESTTIGLEPITAGSKVDINQSVESSAERLGNVKAGGARDGSARGGGVGDWAGMDRSGENGAERAGDGRFEDGGNNSQRFPSKTIPESRSASSLLSGNPLFVLLLTIVLPLIPKIVDSL